jgi:hypothetical protein
MARDRMVGEWRRGIAMIVMPVDIVTPTPHRLAQGIIEPQGCGSFGTTNRFRLLEQRRDATVLAVGWEPRRFREEARQVGCVSTLEHTARDGRQTFVVQDEQTCQVMLKMAQLAPILKEITKDVCVGRHDGSRSYDGKLPKTFALSPKGAARSLSENYGCSLLITG